jgi:hypothetical protein
MLFVVKIEVDTDTSIEAVSQYRIFPSIDPAAILFRQLREHYSQVTPLGPSGKLNIVAARIYKSTASDDASAIADVESGSAVLINDAAIHDLIPAARS